MTETVLIAVLCLLAGAGIAALAAYLMRPRAADPSEDARSDIADMVRWQSENAGRLEANLRALMDGQSRLQHHVNERLDQVSHRMHQSMTATTQQTTERLQGLHERLAVIDTAQKNITDLASQVTSLQNVLSNKQSRGAFGQGQMEAIVADMLPKGAYEFQRTLSNKTRPDCAILMPDSGPLIIDAKFPLEAMSAMRGAASDDERRQAVARVKQDITKHISDIAEKYLIPGETQDIALMFIPSESLYADLHEYFDDMVQRANRARVMIVSPTLMVMAIQIIKQVRKDAEMRDAAVQIQTEVGHMMKDVRLLGERVRKLQTHFGQAGEDMNNILTSTTRIEKRGSNIEELDFESDAGASNVIPAPIRKLEAGE
jgi:DNA recombination protein RmuC